MFGRSGRCLIDACLRECMEAVKRVSGGVVCKVSKSLVLKFFGDQNSLGTKILWSKAIWVFELQQNLVKKENSCASFTHLYIGSHQQIENLKFHQFNLAF